MILANHFAPSRGNEVDFIGSNGVFYRRYFEAFTPIAGTDILIATLDCDLPSYVTPLKLLPADFTDYILNSSQYPAVAFVNQDRRLLVGQYDGISNIHDPTYGYYEDNINVVQSSNSVLSKFYYPIRMGDSGSPAMMLINGQLTLMGVWHYGGDTPDAAENLTDINTAIETNATALSTYDGGAYAESTTYTISTVDLSSFTDYSALV
jgi:hypothetical protein